MIMTKLLEQAFEKARRLSPEEQDALGAILLEEMADEARWAKKFAETRDLIDSLAEEALDEFRAGRTEPMDFPPTDK
jgi:hypothetical protein